MVEYQFVELIVMGSIPIIRQLVVSSMVEHFFYTEEVIGSSPILLSPLTFLLNIIKTSI